MRRDGRGALHYGLLTLGAAKGTTITVTAKGQDATSCLQAIDDLLANRFGEGE